MLLRLLAGVRAKSRYGFDKNHFLVCNFPWMNEKAQIILPKICFKQQGLHLLLIDMVNLHLAELHRILESKLVFKGIVMSFQTWSHSIGCHAR